MYSCVHSCHRFPYNKSKVKSEASLTDLHQSLHVGCWGLNSMRKLPKSFETSDKRNVASKSCHKPICPVPICPGAHLSGAHLSWCPFVLMPIGLGAHLSGAHLSGAHSHGAHVFWCLFVLQSIDLQPCLQTRKLRLL